MEEDHFKLITHILRTAFSQHTVITLARRRATVELHDRVVALRQGAVCEDCFVREIAGD
jgi:ABC-type bacteriocin/lantibiotic exporter with double-glycine peptidase domain